MINSRKSPNAGLLTSADKLTLRIDFQVQTSLNRFELKLHARFGLPFLFLLLFFFFFFVIICGLLCLLSFVVYIRWILLRLHRHFCTHFANIYWKCKIYCFLFNSQTPPTGFSSHRCKYRTVCNSILISLFFCWLVTVTKNRRCDRKYLQFASFNASASHISECILLRDFWVSMAFLANGKILWNEIEISTRMCVAFLSRLCFLDVIDIHNPQMLIA